MAEIENILSTIGKRLDEINKATADTMARIKELQSKPKRTIDDLKEIGVLHEKMTEMHGRVAAYEDVLNTIKQN